MEKELKYKYLTNYLKDGEEILLEIAPNKGFMFHLYDIILIGFTIFALILSILMISASSFDVFSVFPLVFGIIIIWTFSNTFFKRYQNSIHTWYYITNHRIIFRRKLKRERDKQHIDFQKKTKSTKRNTVFSNENHMDDTLHAINDDLDQCWYIFNCLKDQTIRCLSYYVVCRSLW